MAGFNEYLHADSVLKKAAVVVCNLYGTEAPSAHDEAEQKEYASFAKAHSYAMLKAAVLPENRGCLAELVASGLVSRAQCYRLLESERVEELFPRLVLLMPERARELGKLFEKGKLSGKGSGEGGAEGIGNGHFGLAAGSRSERAWLREQGRYDFSGYLRKFGSTREELVLDVENFDHIYYTLGLNRYGRMPLIEPLEYTESSRLQEMVIAFDSSYSCSEELVLRFLSEIRKIVTTKENFFRRMNVVIIQCDSMIQKVDHIHSVEDWERYERELAIVGRGGTDFIPVFEYVEKLRENGKLKALRNLLYFTDGNGVYPRKPTDYETAFVYPDRRFLEYGVPGWIVPLCLSNE